MVKLKVTPPSGLLLTQISSPCCVKILLTIDNPSPVLTLDDRALSAL